jgi:hypothetical protein
MTREHEPTFPEMASPSGSFWQLPPFFAVTHCSVASFGTVREFQRQLVRVIDSLKESAPSFEVS